MNKQRYSPKAAIAQTPGYEFTSRIACDEKTKHATSHRYKQMQITVAMAKGKNKTQCTDTIPNPAWLPNRRLCKQHTETNIETNKPNKLSQHVQSTQIHTLNTHDDTNKSNVPTKNVTNNTSNAKVNLQNYDCHND